MTPEKRGERWRLALIMSWVAWVVLVSQHTARFSGGCAVEKEKGWASSSPGCSSILEKSTLRALTLGGVERALFFPPYELPLIEELLGMTAREANADEE